MAVVILSKNLILWCFVIFCVLEMEIQRSLAFNLDARFSVIKTGTANSYFGYSVAQHQIVDENSPEKILENVFLIGSPKQGDLGGAIYRCDAASAAESCEQITDGLPTKGSADILLDDQWLGVSIASQGTGKKAVACAHRFIMDNKALGVCYVFTQTLEPRFDFRPCDKVSNRNFMQDFGLCQAGMSAAIGQEDSLLMGAPGSVFWRGSVFLTNVTDELGSSTAEIESPYEDPGQETEGRQPSATRSYSYQGYALTMGRFDSSKTLYYASGAPNAHGKGSVVLYQLMKRPQRSLAYEQDEVLDGPVPFSGFGSSLLAVDLNNDGFDDLIVGAPYYYSNNQGGAFYVYLGGQDMLNKRSTRTEVLNRKMTDEECKELTCEHSRFGISLAKLGDVNMDSFQDFVVGAPYEGSGAIYIYHGQQDAPGFTQQYVQRIEGSDLPQPFSDIKSFGHSLSGGMDLDGNGYPDLLVGAYESDTVALIRTRPIIRLIPRMSVAPTLIDLDGTAECKLAGVTNENKNRLCIGVEICLKFTTKPEDGIQMIPTVVYTLEAEKRRPIARVELQDASDSNKKIVTGKTLQLDRQKEKCVTEIAFIKSKFDDKLNPIEFTFTFDLTTDSLSPSPFPTSATQDINSFPILETEGEGQALDQGTNHVGVEVDFVKECGKDQICDSNIQFDSQIRELGQDKEGNYEILIQKRNEIYLSFDVSNQGEAAYLTQVFIQKPPLVTYLETEKEENSQVTCQDVKDDDTMIECSQIGNPLRTGEQVVFEVRLDVPKELAESTTLYNITTWVNTSSIEQTPLNDKAVLMFRVINKANVFLSTSVQPDNTIVCQGEPRGASGIEDEEGIGEAVNHNFVVRNSGPGVVLESYITIWWPYEVAGTDGSNGKYLLYLMRNPKIFGPVVQCNHKEIEKYVNPLQILEKVNVSRPASLLMFEGDQDLPYVVEDPSLPLPSKDGNSNTAGRVRREAQAAQARQSSSGKVVTMSCLDGTAKCFEFKCMLGKLEAGGAAGITFESRLWESTLLSDYRQATEVQIISWGNLTLPKKSMIIQDTTDDMARAVTSARPDLIQSASQELKWWIILVAVIAGIIVLLVVILILYKMGFFRRKPEHMQMYKAEKKQQPMMNDYDDDNL